jgi:hypothetical protein
MRNATRHKGATTTSDPHEMRTQRKNTKATASRMLKIVGRGLVGLASKAQRFIKARYPFGRAALAERKARPADRPGTIEGLQRTLVAARSLNWFICMCAWCKRVRDEEHRWTGIDKYLSAHSRAQITHGICPDCLSDQLERITASSVETVAPMSALPSTVRPAAPRHYGINE